MKIHNKISKRSAFTMLELVFVIVVIGILTSLAIPRLDRDLRQTAIDTILSSVRYTQHLALLDNRQKFNKANWQKSFWTMRFQANGDYFTISSNIDYGTNVDKNESAIDPANGKLFYSNDAIIDADESPNIFLHKKFGINVVDFTNCQNIATGVANTSTHIAFDYMGRPHKGVYNTATNVYSTRMTADCRITFQFEDGSADIDMIIKKETGYAYIEGQEDF